MVGRRRLQEKSARFYGAPPMAIALGRLWSCLYPLSPCLDSACPSQFLENLLFTSFRKEIKQGSSRPREARPERSEGGSTPASRARSAREEAKGAHTRDEKVPLKTLQSEEDDRLSVGRRKYDLNSLFQCLR